MNLHRRTQRTVLLAAAIITIFCVSSIFNNFDPISHQKADQVLIDNVDPLNQSGIHYNDPSYMAGTNRSMRVYLKNASSTSGYDAFNITSATEGDYLTTCQANFTLPMTYRTTHTLEDETPLEIPTYLSKVNPAYTNMTLKNGSLGTPTWDNSSLGDDSDGTLVNCSSTTGNPNMIEFQIDTRTVGITSNIDALQLTRLGFVITLRYIANQTFTVNSSKYNQEDSVWVQEKSQDSTVVSQTIEMKIRMINQNLKYINSTNANANFSIYFFNATNNIGLKILDIDVEVITAREIELHQNQMVALEFNTLGDSLLYGFQAWIRAFNVTAASETSNLTFELYRYNLTTPVSRQSLIPTGIINPTASPNMAELIAATSVLNFNGDGLTWFNLTDNYQGLSLNISNYFIVIKSNTTIADGGKGFSLVTLPYSNPAGGYTANYFDSQNIVDHLMLVNTTASWNLVKISATPCDAANFTLNLTRAWRPNPTELNLTMDSQLVSDGYIIGYPHDESGNYNFKWWGIGSIDHTFINPVKANNGNMTVIMNWTGAIDHIAFNVSYLVNKYVPQTAYSVCTFDVDEIPKWNVTFPYQPTDYPNWIFLEMWYFVPIDWTGTQLIAKDGADYFAKTGFDSPLNNQDVIKVNNDSIVGLPTNKAGNYTFIARSPNYITNTSLYLHYNNFTWQTNGFMRGDNISIDVELRDSAQTYIKNNGNASVKIFNTTGYLNPLYGLFDNQIDLNQSSYSYYQFNTTNIFETNSTTPLGTYTTVAYWINGEEAGVFKRNLFVNNFTIGVPKIDYDKLTGKNKIWGTLGLFNNDIEYHQLYLYAVKQLNTQDIANLGSNYLYNESFDVQMYSDIFLTNIAQNETFINPGETINFTISFQNRHPTLAFEPKVEIALVSALNSEWIIANLTSEPLSLAILGDPLNRDKNSTQISLRVPTLSEGGYNCPLRLAPMRLRITLYIQDQDMAAFTSNNYLYYSNVTESVFEGKTLTYNSYTDRVGPSYISSFDRTLLNIPGTTHYFIQTTNTYYMTANMVQNVSNFQEYDGKISNLHVSQEQYSHISNVNLVGQAMNEINQSLSSVTLFLKYYNYIDKTWYTAKTAAGLDSFTTDVNGLFDIVVPLSQTPLSSIITFQISYNGNPTLVKAFTQNFNITIAEYDNDLDISFSINKLVVGSRNVFTLILTNSGNSTLTNIQMDINSSFAETIARINKLETNELITSNSFDYQIVMSSKVYNKQNVTVIFNINAAVKETGEVITKQFEYVIKVYRADEALIYQVLFIGFFFLGVALIWGYAISYIRRKYREINQMPTTPSDETKKPKRQTGKYVKVAELSKETQKKPEEEKTQKVSGTKLDDLMKVEGIGKKSEKK